MMFAVRQRTRIAWLALVAMLMSALAPSLSHATMASAAGASWGGALAEVCTADGIAVVPGATGQADPRPAPAGHRALRFEHCPYCLSHASTVALPTAIAQAVRPIDGAESAPPAFLRALAPRLARFAAQPRAPPSRA